MSGHFPLALAMVCVNCEVVFPAQSRCPACTSAAIYPVATFLSQRAGRTFTSEAEAELHGLHVVRSA